MTFGSLHSQNDLNLFLATKDLGSPAPKTAVVDVPCSSQQIDYTEAFGDVQYSNRIIKMVFLSMQPWTDQMLNDATVKNALHGRKMQIRFDDIPGVYFVGRISVGGWQYYYGAGKIEVEVNADPWRYKDTITTETQTGDGTITLSNLRRWATPRVTTTAEATLAWSGYSVALGTVTDVLVPELILKDGDTAITVTTAGAVTFNWQEAGL